MHHLSEEKIEFLEETASRIRNWCDTPLSMKKSQKSAQDIQDAIFRKMSADKKIKLGSDFAMFGLRRGLPEGAAIPMSYLKRWLKKNASQNLRHLVS